MLTINAITITGIVRRTIWKGVMPAILDTAIITPAIGHMVRAIPADNCTGTASTAAFMPTEAAASGSKG